MGIEDPWPAQLVDTLEMEGFFIDELKIVAKTGWTTHELSSGIDAAHLKGRFDLVTLMIGVNDQFRGYDIRSFEVEFRSLLDRGTSFAGGDSNRVVERSPIGASHPSGSSLKQGRSQPTSSGSTWFW